jgi:ATP-binding cassette subfamily B protein/subfamily B ATP-binding cassette protein MsbA
MKNFLRALRHSWPYRRRLLLSVVCALLAAVVWGLNFTAIYPVLKILGNEQTLQEWVDGQIEETQKQIEDLNTERDLLHQQSWASGELSDAADIDRRQRELAAAEVRLEGKLKAAGRTLYRYQLMQWVFYQLLPADRFHTLVWLIGLVVVAVAIKGFFEFAQESLVGSVMHLTLYDLRKRFYRNVIHLDVSHFNDHGTHELMARFTNDVELLGSGIKTLYGKVVAEPLRALSCVIVACFISWQLTLLFLVLVPLALVMLTQLGQVMKRATRRLLERMSSIYKILQETFRGIRVVKAYTMEPYERRRFHQAVKDYYRRAMRVINLDAASSPVIEMLAVLTVAAALLVGAYLVLERQTHLFGLRMTSHPLESESLLQFYALLAAIADPVRKLSSVYTRLQSGAAAADRIFQLLDRQPRVQANSRAPRLTPHHVALEFRDVCLSYEPGQPVLQQVCLKVRFGESIALVGRNGCGKTSLVSLVPRFFDPDQGAVCIDGQDVRSVNLRSLRQQVGLVTQETVLFDDTIYNNIAYGSRGARPAEVEEAARKAFAHDFIVALPNGYQTLVGEGGAKLSGGQKQRLALARAILRNPRILILDECTSQTDAESELLIHQALRDFMRDRTTLVITHRLNTLEITDRIVVLEQGRIEAVGTHPELLRSCDIYQRLHEAHFQRVAA